MSNKLLHAEELARLAGVHKSTVLLAIRRGELRASRTVGRSARIAPEDARSYLRSRERPIPSELEPSGGVVYAGAVTESLEIAQMVKQAVPEGVQFLGDGDVYASLISIGAHAPSVIVVDVDITFLNPLVLIRSLRAATQLKASKIIAVGLRDELFTAARAAGVDHALRKVEGRALTELLGQILNGPTEQPD